MEKLPPVTRADKNRAIRQEELRKKLSAGGHLQHAIDSIGKIEKASDSFELSKHKAVFDAQMKLASKYLPDLKAIEHSGVDGEDLPTKVVFEVVRTQDTDN